MSKFETWSVNLAKQFDEQMRTLEAESVEVLNSFDPKSNLHSVINNPITEGIDEG